MKKIYRRIIFMLNIDFPREKLVFYMNLVKILNVERKIQIYVFCD